MKFRFFSMCIFIFIGFLVGLCCGYSLTDVGIGAGDRDVDSGEILSAHSVKLSDLNLCPTAKPVVPDIFDTDRIVGKSAPQWKFRRTPEVLSAQSPDVTFSDGTVSSEERMRRFRQIYPEAYQCIEAARQALDEKRKTVRARRRDFLENIDFALLTESQQQSHRSYTEAVVDRDAIAEKIRGAEFSGKPVPEDMYRSLAAAERYVYEGAKGERKALLEAVARTLGFEGDATQEFGRLIDDIIEVTLEADASAGKNQTSAADLILRRF